MTAPLAPGSISLRLYPHDADPVEQVALLRHQARRAVEAGYEGVMVSEHHADFPGYLPNPIQLAGFLLEAMPTGWAAPCPLLLPMKPYALIAEDLAWLAAAHPGRVGDAVAARRSSTVTTELRPARHRSRTRGRARARATPRPWRRTVRRTRPRRRRVGRG